MTVFVCEGCGQRYNDEIVRERYVGNISSGYKARLDGQKVNNGAHRRGVHHKAHALASKLAREGRVPLLAEHPNFALAEQLSELRLTHIGDQTAPAELGEWTGSDSFSRCVYRSIWAADVDRAEDALVDLEGFVSRRLLRTLTEATKRVRDAAVPEPWWVAWGKALGHPDSFIARGESVGAVVRGDLWRGAHLDQFNREGQGALSLGGAQ